MEKREETQSPDIQSSKIVESLLCRDHLEEIQQRYLISDLDKEQTDINLEDFCTMMRDVISEQISDQELKYIFEKVDIYCKGVISWQQCLRYMTKECLNKDEVLTIGAYPAFKIIKTSRGDEINFRGQLKVVKLTGTDSIKEILYYESWTSKTLEREFRSGQYLTISERGNLDFWSSDIRKMNRLNLIDNNKPGSFRFSFRVTAMVTMENTNMVALSTNLRDIRFYTCHPFLLRKKYEFVDFYHCIVCMNYFIDPDDFNRSYLTIGNENGQVGYFIFTECEIGAPFGASLLYGVKAITNIKDIIKWKGNNIKFRWLDFSFDKWVQEVKYIYNINSIISCCASIQLSLCIQSISENIRHEFKVRGGILCFDYCHVQNLLVTGGMDYTVRIWNPYRANKAYVVLVGHSSPVCKVFVDSKKRIAVSISKDKFVIIWDMERYESVQKFEGDLFGLNRSVTSLVSSVRTMTSAYYNSFANTILIGSNNLEIFRSGIPEGEPIRIKSHTSAIVGVLYSELYDYVISGCQEPSINVWDLRTGAKIMNFIPVSPDAMLQGENMTCIALDPTHERLAIGTLLGFVKLWNFCNGSQLLDLQANDEKEITAINIHRNKIFVVGKDRRVTIFNDSAYNPEKRIWDIMHKDDITTVSVYKDLVAATCSYDGEIILWSIDTGYVKQILRDKSKQDGGNRYSEQEKRAPRKSGLHGHSSTLQLTLSILNQPYASVDNVMFLENRANHSDIVNLLSTGKDGYMRGWCIYAEGLLLCRFFAAEKKHDAVICMKTDKENEYLITGDTSGYIKVWYLPDFYNMAVRKYHEEFDTFPYIKMAPRINQVQKKLENGLLEDEYAFGDAPHLLNCFQGHLLTIMYIEFVKRHRLIITGSTDKSIRLWNIAGRYLGTFGQKEVWCFDQDYLKAKEYVLPPDIKSRGTAVTLRVLNGGMSRRWKLALNASQFMFRLIIPQRKAIQEGKIIHEVEEMGQKKKYKDGIFQLEIPKYILGKYYKEERSHPKLPPLPLIRNESEVFPFMSLPIFELEIVTLPPRKVIQRKKVTFAKNNIKVFNY